jgi:O-antigen/teichoic acid export membrane protein
MAQTAPPRPDEPGSDSRFDRLKSSQRVAYGAGFRAFGEILSKPASLLFYVVLARQLGKGSFGLFVLAISTTSLLLLFGGLGLKELVGKEVARDRDEVHHLFWNALALKVGLMGVLLPVAVAIVAIGGYSGEALVATLILGIAVGLENLTAIISGVLQGFERQQYIATALLLNRFSTAAMGITALLAGAGLVPAAALTAFGSALGLVTAFELMQRRVVRPRLEIDPRRWRGLIRAGFPLGVIGMLGQAVLGSSVVLLGLLTANQAEVGDYGAAFRLIETTVFISWSFSSALMPWFSRHSGQQAGAGGLARGFEMSLNGIISVMLPLALTISIFADPLVKFLYGEDYAGAIEPLRVLAAMTVLWGINGVVTAVVVGRGRPRAYVIPALVAVLLTLALAIVLMPKYGAVGAAVTTVPAAAALSLLTITATTRIVGIIRPLRVLVAPASAGLLMAGTTVLVAGIPWPAAVVVSLGAYAAAFLAIERISYPDDFTYYARIMGRPARGRRTG